MTKKINFQAFLLVAIAVTLLAAPAQAQWTDDGSVVRLTTSSDNVGIGTASASNKLVVSSTVLPQFVLDGGSGNEARFQLKISNGQPVFLFNYQADNGADMGTQTFSGFGFQTNTTRRMFISAAGNVGIGTSAPTSLLHVNGNAFISGSLTGGNIAATYQDVAEWVPATEDLEPGTVVILNPEASNQVMPSKGAYDTTVAGVVSAQPGLILGVAGKSKEQIATTGRVKVRVDATAGPIKVGDLLVTSDKRGYAMKSEPIKVQGRSFHQPGTIIGKALEPLADGQGEILVLLSMQ